MTPMEILGAAIKGQPAPRIPIFCNLLDQGARELGMSQKEYYANGENVAEGQLRMRARYGYDCVWSLFYIGKKAELLGSREVLFDDGGSPTVADYVIKDYDDIAKLEVPDDITAHPAWEETAKCLKILREEVGASHPICANVTASTTLPTLLMGMEKWMELLTMGPFDLRDELLRKCSDFFHQEVAAYRAAGANVLVYSTPFGSTYFVGMKRFKELSLPWMKRDLAPGGVDGIVYFCALAPYTNIIGQIMAELGIGAYLLSPLDDLAEAKMIIGQKGLTCGVIDDIKMIRWTYGEIRAEVQRLCDLGKPGGHFLFSTGIMPQAIPEANIQAMVEAAFEYGRLQ